MKDVTQHSVLGTQSSKVAWVTGGGTGIGRALAQALVRDGWRVAISGRRAELLQETAQSIKASEAVLTLPGDISDASTVQQAVRSIQERWGPVELMINNAGKNTYHSFQESTPEEYEQSFRLNCMSAIHCSRAVLPGMLTRQSGAIVNISSILGIWASADSSPYSVSKYALAGFTDSLRQELAGTGVRVMGVYPGFILTPMTTPFVSPGSRRWRYAKSPEAMAAAILKSLKRGKRELIYPWYVPLVLGLHRVFPETLEKFRKLFRR